MRGHVMAGFNQSNKEDRSASLKYIGFLISRFLLIGWFVLIMPAAALSHQDSGLRVSAAGAERVVVLFPEGRLFPAFIADPHRPRFGIQIMNLSESGIADAGDQRFNLQTGGRFGLIRIHPPEASNLGWQLSVEGGIDAQFDIDLHLDNIGWDGNYGLMLEYLPAPEIAFRIAALHTSSHVGDEYAENFGRKRIEYTRNEFAAAVSMRPAERWNIYAEYGRGYNLRNDILQEPVRLQAGLEYEVPASLWGGRIGWYAAIDLQSWEERNWRLDFALQAGLLFKINERDWRFGIEHVRGRPTMGEFFRDTESWTSFGLWIDI